MSHPRHPSTAQYHRLLAAARAAQEVLAFVSTSIRQIADAADKSETTQVPGQHLLELMEQARAEPRLSLVNFASALKLGALSAGVDAQGSVAGMAAPKMSALIPAFTFETFVTSAANMLVVGAPKEFVELLKAGSNSLFIAGPIGVGKTHLLHAIGNGVRSKYPRAKVRYMTTGHFVSEVIDAYTARSFSAFRRHFEALDVLLLDDIDGLTKHKRTQEALTAILDVLVEQGSSIVMAGHCRPKELRHVQKRLLSRFVSSRVYRIEPPDQSLRVAILLRKSHDANTQLPVDVATELANRLPGDVRALEGALRNVLAFAKYHRCEIDLAVIDEAAGLPPTSAVEP